MKMGRWMVLVVIFLIFATIVHANCSDQYESCKARCEGYWLGSEKEQCRSNCLDEYNACRLSEYNSSRSCCGSAFIILGLLGLSYAATNKEGKKRW
jgi:hypothetical protein